MIAREWNNDRARLADTARHDGSTQTGDFGATLKAQIVSDVAFVTIIAANYGAYALALMNSLSVHHLRDELYIVVADALDRDEMRDLASATNAHVISPLDFLPYEFAMGLAYSYDVTELCTALKPFALRRLLDLGHRRAVYLDPDILVLQSMECDVLVPLEAASIVLTPHVTEPIPLDGLSPNEITLLAAGAYNLGFIGVRDCYETRGFLSWWADRLERFCLSDIGHALFVDQKWIDLVPGMFAGTAILRHRGLNVAYWNLHTRPMVTTDNGPALATGETVIFFHFSGFDPRKPGALSRHQDRIDPAGSPALETLLAEYARTLVRYEHHRRSQLSYGYGTLSDETPVDNIVRLLCREARDRGLVFPDPYDVDAEPSLLDYCNGSDAAENDEFPRFTRYLARLHASRTDLQATFPDPHGADRARYVHWVGEHSSHGPGRFFAAAASNPPVERTRGGPTVNVAGYFASESGVGEAGRAHVAAVRAAGCNVHLVDFTIGAVSSRRREAVADGVSTAGRVNLICVNADQLPVFERSAGVEFFRNRYSIGSWYWEMPAFPEAWLDRFEPLDEVWVGSEYVRSAVGTHSPIPVVRIPPIVAPPAIRDPSKERFGWAAETFVFIYFFDYLSVFERKNPLGAVEAFRRAFAGRKDVALVIKTINSSHDMANAARLARQCAGDPRIEIRNTYLSRNEKNAMIAAADCYVSLHRAEGFGLSIAEAMYYGTPVICTNWSGNVDFANAANAHVVPAALAALDRDYGPYAAGQFWADPDLDAAAVAMRHVVDDRVDAQLRAARAATDIRTYYSADSVSAVVRARLERVLGEFEPAN